MTISVRRWRCAKVSKATQTASRDVHGNHVLTTVPGIVIYQLAGDHLMKITHHPLTTFSWNEVENVTCLIEAMNEMENQSMHVSEDIPESDRSDQVKAGERFLKLRGDHGSFIMRAAVASLADEVETAFAAVEALTDDDPPCFDFEFCYRFLIGALDNGLLALAIELQYTPYQECQAKIDAWLAHPADNALAA